MHFQCHTQYKFIEENKFITSIRIELQSNSQEALYSVFRYVIFYFIHNALPETNQTWTVVSVSIDGRRWKFMSCGIDSRENWRTGASGGCEAASESTSAFKKSNAPGVSNTY